MASVTNKRATLDDLYCTPEKAELIGGTIVTYMATGRKPNRVAGRIYRSLDDHATNTVAGEAFTDNMGYTVPILPSGRESFSPDASFHRGPFPADVMRFIAGGPHFAVEVRSENDYGPAAQAEMADKRADYFQAGTEVVWDVDTVGERVHAYRASDPKQAITFRRGDIADAEPAVPGWRVAIDWIFS
jgi:Uma2 family endonuclease